MKTYYFKVTNNGLTKLVGMCASSKKKAMKYVLRHPSFNNPIVKHM